MKKYCLIRCLDMETPHFEWLVHNEVSCSELRTGVPSDEDLSSDTVIIGLMPNEQVLLKAVQLPATNRRKALAAIPFMLEEDLAEELESYHFALLLQEPTQAQVAVVAQTDMQKILAAFDEVNITLDKLIPEGLCIQDREDWTVIQDVERFIVAAGPFTRYAASTQSLPLMLAGLANLGTEEVETQDVSAFITSEQAESLIAGALGSKHFQLATHQTIAPFLKTLDSFFNAEQLSGNLLQGAFHQKREVGQKGTWLLSGLMLILTVVVAFASTVYQHISLTRTVEKLDKQLLTVYQKAFPTSHVVRSPKILIQREIEKYASANEADNFLPLLAATGKQLKKQPAIEMVSLSYRNQELVLNCFMPDFKSLEQFTAKLEAENIAVKRDMANRTGERVQVRLIIKQTEKAKV